MDRSSSREESIGTSAGPNLMTQDLFVVMPRPQTSIVAFVHSPSVLVGASLEPSEQSGGSNNSDSEEELPNTKKTVQ